MSKDKDEEGQVPGSGRCQSASAAADAVQDKRDKRKTTIHIQLY